MLWDSIRDFFVKLVFGGVGSDYRAYGGMLGRVYNIQNQGEYNMSVNNVYLDLSSEWQITLGDWLSTTATIISISIIVVLCCLFVYKIIKLIGGLIR